MALSKVTDIVMEMSGLLGWFLDDSEISVFMLSIQFGYTVAFLVFNLDKTLFCLAEKLPNIMNVGNDQFPGFKQKQWTN